MIYMGGKAAHASELLAIILRGRKAGQWYVEPFAGGMNVICKADGNRIANDINPYLIALWRAIVEDGWAPPRIEKETYDQIRVNKEEYPPCVVGWAGFGCSFRGKFFGGFAGLTRRKSSTRDYQEEALQNMMRQAEYMRGAIFINKPYADIPIPERSIIYCDPPYAQCTGYDNTLGDHSLFWSWVRKMACQRHTVFVSEYSAPDDFVDVWCKDVSSSLSVTNGSSTVQQRPECLFTLRENWRAQHAGR